MTTSATPLDFIQAAHELFRRQPNMFRNEDFVRGLYIGMGEAELRAYLVEQGAESMIEVIEEAGRHDGAWTLNGFVMPAERPSNGHLSCFHLSVSMLVQEPLEPVFALAA